MGSVHARETKAPRFSGTTCRSRPDRAFCICSTNARRLHARVRAAVDFLRTPLTAPSLHGTALESPKSILSKNLPNSEREQTEGV